MRYLIKGQLRNILQFLKQEISSVFYFILMDETTYIYKAVIPEFWNSWILEVRLFIYIFFKSYDDGA